MKKFISKWLEDNNIPIINTDGDYMISKQGLSKLLAEYKQCNTPNEGQSEQYHCELHDFGRKDKPCDKQCAGCKAMKLD